MPVTQEEMESPLYEVGISCPHCYNSRSDADRARYAERQKQVKLAQLRGKAHIGEE